MADVPEYWLCHLVIKAEYLTPGLANESRRQKLASIGAHMGRTNYYKLLNRARKWVAAELDIRCETIGEEEFDHAC